MNVKIIVYQGKTYIIAKKNVLALLRNKQKYNYANYMQVMNEVDVKICVSHCAKRSKIHRVR